MPLETTISAALPKQRVIRSRRPSRPVGHGGSEADNVGLQNLLMVVGLALRFEMLDHRFYLVLGDEAALEALRLRILGLAEKTCRRGR